MYNYNLINDKLFEYLEGTCLDDFRFVKALNNIILRNPLKRKHAEYDEKIDLNYSASLAYSFFKSLSEDYALYFEKRINDGTFRFSKKFPIGTSSYDKALKKRIINIPITNNIGDSFVMVHELLHDMNLDINGNTLCRMLTSEAISMLGELLFRDFLIKHNLIAKDNYKPIINNFLSVDSMATSNKFELCIIEEYLQNGYVDISFLKDLYTHYDDDTINTTISTLFDDSLLEYEVNQRYIIGALLSCYMYQRIEENPKCINELMDINSIMNETYFENLINYLDLEIKPDDEWINLSNDSFEKLEKCYKKELKRL